MRSYKHIQTTPATTWTVSHNLGTKPVVDIVIDSSGTLQKILPLSVIAVNDYVIQVNFSSPQSGEVRAIGNGEAFNSTFRFWRLYVTANDGDTTYVSFSDIEILDVLENNFAFAQRATATQSGDGAVGPATDGADTNQGTEAGSTISGSLSTNPYTWQIDLGQDRTISMLRLKSQRVVTGRTPSNFILQGSATSSGPWSDVITVTGETGWGIQEQRYFTIPGYSLPAPSVPTTYQFWRLYATANDGDSNYISFGEIELKNEFFNDVTYSVRNTALQNGDGAVGGAAGGADDTTDNECGSSLSSLGGAAYTWQIDLGTAQTIYRMTLTSQRAVTGRTPTDFKLQGGTSANGPWNDVMLITDSTTWGITEKRSFVIP